MDWYVDLLYWNIIISKRWCVREGFKVGIFSDLEMGEGL